MMCTIPVTSHDECPLYRLEWQSQTIIVLPFLLLQKGLNLDESCGLNQQIKQRLSFWRSNEYNKIIQDYEADIILIHKTDLSTKPSWSRGFIPAYGRIDTTGPTKEGTSDDSLERMQWSHPPTHHITNVSNIPKEKRVNIGTNRRTIW